MAQDFSGFARAGAIKGQTLANLGQNIGDIIKVRGEQKKQDAANEKFIKQAVDMFKGTSLEEPVTNLYQNYTSEDTTDRERRAIGASVRETIGLGMQAQDMKRQQELLNLRRAEAAAKGRGDAPGVFNIPAAIDLMRGSGFGAQADSLQASLEAAKTPEEQQAVANMISSFAGGISPSKLSQPDSTVKTYKISGTPSMVAKGDKKVAEWAVTAPDGREFTVNAEEKKRLNKAIQSGKDFDLEEVLGRESLLGRTGDFVRNLLGDGEYGEQPAKDPSIPDFQRRYEANLEVIRLTKLANEGDVKAAEKLAALKNTLSQGGLRGQLNFATPEEQLGQPFE
jgi:hypothetical protein